MYLLTETERLDWQPVLRFYRGLVSADVDWSGQHGTTSGG